jgi:hypothetical protein
MRAISMANPDLQLLTDAAKSLEPILGELLFVGGCATALLMTDGAAADVRATAAPNWCGKFNLRRAMCVLISRSKSRS